MDWYDDFEDVTFDTDKKKTDPVSQQDSPPSNGMPTQVVPQDTAPAPNKNDLEWVPKNKLNLVPDDILEKAFQLVKDDLISKVSLYTDDKGVLLVKVFYSFSACVFGRFKERVLESPDNRNLGRCAVTSFARCSDNNCGELFCIPMVAGYLKWADEHGVLESVLKERDDYRARNYGSVSNLMFEWEPADAADFKRLPPYLFSLAEQMIAKGLVMLRPFVSDDNRFYIDFKKIGDCANTNKEGKKVGGFSCGPHDLGRAVSAIESPSNAVPNGWLFGLNSRICASPYGACKCLSNFCPYVVAAYILYLRYKGRDDVVVRAKAYGTEHPEDIFWGHGNFSFKLSDEGLQKMKQSIASVSDNILAAAFRFLDRGEAFLLPSQQETKSGSKGFVLNCSCEIADKPTLEECLAECSSKKETQMYLFSSFSDYENISVKNRLVRLMGSLDYCRRNKIDISDVLDKRHQDIVELKNLSEEITGLERLYAFVKSDKTSTLSCIMQGSIGSGKTEVIESVANLLSQNGKISTNKYDVVTLEQLAEKLTGHPCGFTFEKLDTGKLYVLTGLDEFLRFYKWYSDNKSYQATGIAFRHIVRELGSFTKNTFVIIISPSKASTEEFLELNKKYKYTFGQNIVVFDNKSEDELYEEYVKELSDDVKSKITDTDAHRKRFSEFISLNERFLPFLNANLSHYLAEFSNLKGAPVFPPDVYDRKSIIDSLDTMIGMGSVKEQLARFESYITFQKKAKAVGIKVKQGNLHMQFLGNPGTGKTTIARIVAKMLYDIGILEENKLVEVERKDLIGQYLGDTAIKTSDRIKEAMGGVLFVDEAYSLFLNDDDVYGKEAIATLIKAMEDCKDKLIVIFAGYSKEMHDFLKANSGIESRIGYTFHFEDYSASELTEIFRRSITGQNFKVDDAVLAKVKDVCEYYRKHKNFGNGRFAKRIEQQAIINHAGHMGRDGWDICTITADEIPDIRDMGVQSSVSNGAEISLDDIIGMDSVKKQMAKFKKRIQFEQKAKAAGIKVPQGNMHMLFLGNPGTGKTTIARIVVKELYESGAILENKLVEVERKDLVGRYIGETAPKTADVIERAMGGVLFIDEAYTLYNESGKDFGAEAVATIIKAMEDYKDKLVVIFAGYSKEMHDFLKVNSGIESRIGYTFHFEDYTASELTEMFRRSITGRSFLLADGVLDKVSEVCSYYRKRKNFGNGRFVKRVEQETLNNHANHVDCPGWDVKSITVDDVPGIRDLAMQSSVSEDVLLPLDKVIGMKNVKEQIQKFRKRIRFEQRAKEAGAKIKRGNSHMLFLGNPGTGKTTIARILTKELFEAGVILENKLLEVERKDLVGRYIGETAPKTSDVIERAMGGVLFIDEAYSLYNESGSDFGAEAVATIIKAMEDHKDEFVVIFAGYEKEMADFLAINSGIASRIGYTFTFEDYNADELAEIFKLKLKGNGLGFTDDAIASVKNLMQYFSSVPNFGNGRFAERVVNVAIEFHAERVTENESDDILMVTADDIPSVKHMLDLMPDGKNMINPDSIKESQHERTAVHELGHALVVKLLTPWNHIERITISAEGNGALGYVSHRTEAVGNQTKSELEAMICVKMAGIAAEELFLGEYGNGGTSDLQGATAIATNMVLRFGMSKHGFAAFKELDESGKHEINQILMEQFNRAKSLLDARRDVLAEAKTYLLEHRTITDDEFSYMVFDTEFSHVRE